MKEGYFTSPSEALIVGTFESLTGTALASAFTVGPDGTIEPEYVGQTDIEWNDQRTQRDEHGVMLVVDENGDIWPINKCTFHEGDPSDASEK